MPGAIDFAGLRQVFLDMDGTIYEGDHLYDCTLPFLNFLKSRGVGYAFITNNSSWSTPEYVEKLHRMGQTAFIQPLPFSRVTFTRTSESST